MRFVPAQSRCFEDLPSIGAGRRAKKRWCLVVLAVIGVCAPLPATTVELRDASLIPAGAPSLANGSGTVRLESGRLGALAPAIQVPEPGLVVPLSLGVGFLGFLARRPKSQARRGVSSPLSNSEPC